MKKCQFKNELDEYVEGSIDSKTRYELEHHLRECPACSQQLAGLQRVHRLLQNRQRPEPSLELLYNYQTSLEKYFPVKTRFAIVKEWITTTWQNVQDYHPVGLRIATAAALIIFGIFIGRLIFYTPTNEILNNQQTDLVVIKLDPEDLKLVSDYFVQSEILLLAIKNAPDEGSAIPSEFTLDKKLAQELLRKTLFIQEKAALLNNESLLTYLNQIEFLLLEISNTDDQEIISVFKQIRQVINATRLLYESKNFQQMFKDMV